MTLRNPLRDELEKLRRRWGDEAFWQAISEMRPARGMPEIDDMVWLDLMARMIRRNEAKTKHDAARKVVELFGADIPGPSAASKIKRLETKYPGCHNVPVKSVI